MANNISQVIPAAATVVALAPAAVMAQTTAVNPFFRDALRTVYTQARPEQVFGLNALTPGSLTVEQAERLRDLARDNLSRKKDLLSNANQALRNAQSNQVQAQSEYDGRRKDFDSSIQSIKTEMARDEEKITQAKEREKDLHQVFKDKAGHVVESPDVLAIRREMKIYQRQLNKLEAQKAAVKKQVITTTKEEVAIVAAQKSVTEAETTAANAQSTYEAVRNNQNVSNQLQNGGGRTVGNIAEALEGVFAKAWQQGLVNPHQKVRNGVDNAQKAANLFGVFGKVGKRTTDAIGTAGTVTSRAGEIGNLSQGQIQTNVNLKNPQFLNGVVQTTKLDLLDSQNRDPKSMLLDLQILFMSDHPALQNFPLNGNLSVIRSNTAYGQSIATASNYIYRRVFDPAVDVNGQPRLARAVNFAEAKFRMDAIELEMRNGTCPVGNDLGQAITGLTILRDALGERATNNPTGIMVPAEVLNAQNKQFKQPKLINEQTVVFNQAPPQTDILGKLVGEPPQFSQAAPQPILAPPRLNS